ncbi:hypothetical protein [Oceanobacillus polygoni]|uniref:Uncharacterized protein n=1 Tax=Oceanobacillus polygoni TaxID=1235259 RepID=A0A9X0Z1S5_9BACI|nr:hypothetical protein [Oceanobacillus polygoni]MBP2079636.1 hypothetical protein [Oceanobacillus polygoni]
MAIDEENELLLEQKLNQKLYFVEMEQALVEVTYCLKTYDYTIEQAIPRLIKIIDMLEVEQKVIMNEISKIIRNSG